MSRYLSFASLIFLLLVSCGKEQSFEQARLSRGSLQDPSGDCQAKTIAGIYKVGQSLADSNYIDVVVSVTQPGRYTVFTDTVNGYYFTAAGNFGSAGTTTVRLKGFGTPGAEGVDDFIMFYDSSFCSFSITVLPNTGSSGGTAVYTLNQGTGGSCITANASGTYTQGIALNSANKVDIQVNVTTVGTWNVSTQSVAGFSFSGSGTFTATGVQNITLVASGTPTASGTQTFPVTVGSSSCSFPITINPGSNPPPVTSDDYFPRTTNSNWTYISDGDTTSKVRRFVIAPTLSALGNIYNIFMEDDLGTVDSSGYYRRSGNNYYVYGDVGLANFDKPVPAEVLFIKDNAAVNATWTSGPFSGTAGGTPVQIRYKETILQKNVQLTVNGVAFQNVIAIKNQSELNIAGTGWTDLTPALGYTTTYYAKGIGLIRTEEFDGSGVKVISSDLYSYKVF